MALLHAARRGCKTPMLARVLLAVGVVATLAANVAHGWAHGPVGAVIAAWPAVALVGSYELLMWLVRASASATSQSSAPEQEAVAAYRASIAAGEPLSQRKLAERFGRSRRWAAQVIREAMIQPA